MFFLKGFRFVCLELLLISVLLKLRKEQANQISKQFCSLGIWDVTDHLWSSGMSLGM